MWRGQLILSLLVKGKVLNHRVSTGPSTGEGGSLTLHAQNTITFKFMELDAVLRYVSTAPSLQTRFVFVFCGFS